MADSSHGRASFWTRANALLRKNLTFQKRNKRTNIRLILFPFLLCLILVLIQNLVNHLLDNSKYKCGCTCVDSNGNGQCDSAEKVCGIQYSTLDQASSCPIPSPPEWPPLLQIPAPEYRAVRTDFVSFTDLPDQSCRNTGTCPATILFTGNNQTLGERLAANLFTGSSTLNSSDILYSLAYYALGSATETENTNFLDPAFFSNQSLYNLEPQCSANATIPVSVQIASSAVTQEAICVQGLNLWRNSSSEVNDELYKGYWKGNSERKINEFVAAYDFLNTDSSNFNVSIWYNSTYNNDTGNVPLALLRVPRSVNLASNSYLQYFLGPATEMLFEFVKEMPKPATQLRLDFASLLGPLFFTWVILQLFPIPSSQRKRLGKSIRELQFWLVQLDQILSGWMHWTHGLENEVESLNLGLSSWGEMQPVVCSCFASKPHPSLLAHSHIASKTSSITCDFHQHVLTRAI